MKISEHNYHLYIGEGGMQKNSEWEEPGVDTKLL